MRKTIVYSTAISLGLAVFGFLVVSNLIQESRVLAAENLLKANSQAVQDLSNQLDQQEMRIEQYRDGMDALQQSLHDLEDLVVHFHKKKH
jgi:uncharacterized coiled-coil protein SlyX